MEQSPVYKRILLKLSGEALMGSLQFGIDPKVCNELASEIHNLQKNGVEIGIVVGGGNIFRGVKGSSYGMERAAADHVGMLATVINSITLQQTLMSIGCKTHVLNALDNNNATEPYSWTKAMEYLEDKKVVIFAGGTSHPFFTTDSAAALRACEIKADILLKATKVDGIYNKDPVQHPDAVKYDEITYHEALQQNLQVMDGTAFTLCMENKIPIKVFNISSISKAVSNKHFGTLVKEEYTYERHGPN
ncbi:MAG: uridylate kinase [Chlamydiales bacterium]|jgi:uridylate kinase